MVVTQSAKHSEVTIIGDGVKGMEVTRSGKKEQTVYTNAMEIK